jgi:hypothetical protein
MGIVYLTNNVHIGLLKIEYRWEAPSHDLDSGTTFLGQTVGWNWIPTDLYTLFMDWHYDDVDFGPEVVDVDMAGAFAAGLWNTSVEIKCMADWYKYNDGSGPATLYVLYQGVERTKTISPGYADWGATTPVGTITVNVNGEFTLV